MRSCEALAIQHADIGTLHPADAREGHIQGLLFSGLRASGFHTRSQTNYYLPRSGKRLIDIGVWLPNINRWLYLEVEPCPPFRTAKTDALKLIEENPQDPRDKLRAVLGYHFGRSDKQLRAFQKRYSIFGEGLSAKGFSAIGITSRLLEGDKYRYVLLGLWVVDDPDLD